MEFKCPRCQSKNVDLRIEVPWSTDGLMPHQKIYLQCRDCGFIKKIDSEK